MKFSDDSHNVLFVIPAQAGIQHTKASMDSRFRGNDRRNNGLYILAKQVLTI